METIRCLELEMKNNEAASQSRVRDSYFSSGCEMFELYIFYQKYFRVLPGFVTNDPISWCDDTFSKMESSKILWLRK